MIKNLDDLLSVIVLFVLLINGLSIFIWAFIKRESDNKIKISHIDVIDLNKWELIRDYNDNTEE